jgi:hypothetical protein
MIRFLPHWRKATWALGMFTALASALILSSIGTGASIVPIVFSIIGGTVLGLIWLTSRSRFTTMIFGPQGQQWMVSAKTAESRIRAGWSYSPTTP